MNVKSAAYPQPLLAGHRFSDNLYHAGKTLDDMGKSGYDSFAEYARWGWHSILLR